jgi:hypothetical protein
MSSHTWGIVTITPRIRPLWVNIIIIIQIRKATIGTEIVPSQELRDVDTDMDMDMDVVSTLLIVFPIHF